jgi:DNA-binding transcriptional regulator of glucitol operon
VFERECGRGVPLRPVSYREAVHRYRFALRPGWWALHVLTVALVVTMVLLGRWQLIVSDEKHFNVRNFGYALQWWAFSVFSILMWVRILRDQAKHQHDPEVDALAVPPAQEEPVAYRRYVPPAAAAEQDETLASYNDYLARLNGPDGDRS